MWDQYLEIVARLLGEVRDANRASVHAAASLIADSVAADGIVRAFGSGHSHILAMELFDRAGGLAPIDVIVDPGRGRAENVEGYAVTLLHEDQVRPPDCLIVISVSGRNVSPVDMARIGRERGVPVIAVTSVPFSRSVAPRHSSGERLMDVADVVLDIRVPVGDAGVHVDGLATEVGPLSTVLGAALLNAVMVEAIAELGRRGIGAPVFASQNVDGTDDHNAALNDRYRSRIRALV